MRRRGRLVILLGSLEFLVRTSLAEVKQMFIKLLFGKVDTVFFELQ
jgi:hypothetical protein